MNERKSIEELAHAYGVDIVHYMASTGLGSKECMEKGCLAVSNNYYQPIPDLKELEKRGTWNKVSPMSGIIWDDKTFMDTLSSLAEYSHECDWPNEPGEDPIEFFINNGCFSYGCATALYCLIRKNKPQKIIEVGSGNSSCVIASALRKNMRENASCHAEYTIIDPYSNLNVDLFPKGTTVLRQPIELTDVCLFSNLSENDILFIDSSHVSKIGSDVNFEILDILPILKKGVFVHFHDIPMPYEYPPAYAYRLIPWFWTESYLLQAFLIGNSDYEVLLPMPYMQYNYEALFRELFPKGNQAVLWGSSSFWIKRLHDENDKIDSQQQLSEVQAQVEQLAKQVLDYERTVHAYENSTSWRVTKPIRAVKRLFSHRN